MVFHFDKVVRNDIYLKLNETGNWDKIWMKSTSIIVTPRIVKILSSWIVFWSKQSLYIPIVAVLC